MYWRCRLTNAILTKYDVIASRREIHAAVVIGHVEHLFLPCPIPLPGPGDPAHRLALGLAQQVVVIDVVGRLEALVAELAEQEGQALPLHLGDGGVDLGRGVPQPVVGVQGEDQVLLRIGTQQLATAATEEALYILATVGPIDHQRHGVATAAQLLDEPLVGRHEVSIVVGVLPPLVGDVEQDLALVLGILHHRLPTAEPERTDGALQRLRIALAGHVTLPIHGHGNHVARDYGVQRTAQLLGRGVLAQLQPHYVGAGIGDRCDGSECCRRVVTILQVDAAGDEALAVGGVELATLHIHLARRRWGGAPTAAVRYLAALVILPAPTVAIRVAVCRGTGRIGGRATRAGCHLTALTILPAPAVSVRIASRRGAGRVSGRSQYGHAQQRRGRAKAQQHGGDDCFFLHVDILLVFP